MQKFYMNRHNAQFFFTKTFYHSLMATGYEEEMKFWLSISIDSSFVFGDLFFHPMQIL